MQNQMHDKNTFTWEVEINMLNMLEKDASNLNVLEKHTKIVL